MREHGGMNAALAALFTLKRRNENAVRLDPQWRMTNQFIVVSETAYSGSLRNWMTKCDDAPGYTEWYRS